MADSPSPRCDLIITNLHNSVPPLYWNGSSLEEVLLAAFLPCCLVNVPDEAERCLTEHTGRFHDKRDIDG